MDPVMDEVHVSSNAELAAVFEAEREARTIGLESTELKVTMRSGQKKRIWVAIELNFSIVMK
jgi:hypothetical protein